MDPSTIDTKLKYDEEPNALHLEKGELVDNVTHDAVFGEISDEGPNYRNVRTFLPMADAPLATGHAGLTTR